MARGHFRRRSRPRNPAAGTVETTLEPAEAAVLLQICTELAGVVSGEPGEATGSDPVVERLYPRAYLDPTEEHAEAEWQRLVHDDLVTARRRALETVELTLRTAREEKARLRVDLSPEEAEAWLSVINDARLALGTRLEMTEDHDPLSVDPDDPRAPVYGVYWWLGMMQEELVAVLL